MATAAVLTLSVGTAVQNFPEGAIVLSLVSGGDGKLKAFALGVASGAVEPVAAALAYCLRYVTWQCCRWGCHLQRAMTCVVTEELILQAST